MITDDKEIAEWLDSICEEEPFKSTTDISLVFRADDVTDFAVIAEPEEFKGKTIHFFVSSWVDGYGKAFAAKTKEEIKNEIN